MAAVGDINQDKFTDVAIGAPLEGLEMNDGDSFGSVYIYNGHQDGLSSKPSQVTVGLSLALSLGYDLLQTGFQSTMFTQALSAGGWEDRRHPHGLSGPMS